MNYFHVVVMNLLYSCLVFFVFIKVLNLFLCSLCLFSSADIFVSITLNFHLLIAENISAFVEVLSTLFLWLPIR